MAIVARADYPGRPAYELVLDLAVTSQNRANNTSTVRVFLYARSKSGNGSFYNDPRPFNVGGFTPPVHGSAGLPFESGGDYPGKTITLINTSRIVQHNSSGNATVTVSARHDVGDIFGNAVIGARNWSPPRIPQIPLAPGTPSVGTVTVNSAALSWTAANGRGAAITGYDLQYSVNSNMSGATLVTLGNTTSHTLLNLNPGTTYYARVRARNSVGTGGWSNISSAFTTLPAVPPGITVTPSLTGSSAEVTLSPPSGVSTVTQYVVEYRRTPSGSTMAVTSPTSPVTVLGLTPGAVYEWRAYALIGTYQTPSSPWVPVVQPNPNTSPGDFFDGSTPDRADLTFRWTGTVNNSRSEARGVSPEGWAVEAGSAGGVAQRVTGGRTRGFFARAVVLQDGATGDTGLTLGAAPGSQFNAEATPGGSYVGSIFVRPSRSQRLCAVITWRAANGSTYISESRGEAEVVDPASGWVRLSVADVAPAGAEFAGVGVADVAGSGHSPWLAGEWLDADDAMLSVGELYPYFDGATPNTSQWLYEWLGTPEKSASWALSRSAEFVDPLADPDCPPPPQPPRPPAIVDDCIEEVGQWRRYWAIIPADFVSQWLDVVPTVTLTTGSLPARQVRMRVFENPDGLAPEDFGSEGWIAETIISYMPADATLVLDGISRRAWASVAGGDSVPADRLLYGTGGAPATWPVLSCGISHLIAFDVPLDAPEGNLGIDIALTERSM